MEHGFTRQQVARALRNFTLMGAVWAVYGPNATVTGPVLSGLCLKIGLTDAQVAFLVSLTALMGASQLLSYFLTHSVKNKRLMMITLGFFEITPISLVFLVGLHAAPPQAFLGIAALLVFGLLFGHAVSPTWSSWMGNVIPPEVRSAYIGRRMFILTAVGAVYLFLASRCLDLIAWPLNFALVFGIGWLGGIGGYIIGLVTPYPDVEEPEASPLRNLLQPLREKPFMRLSLFLVTANGVGMLAGAFYSVYMLRYLELSYSLVAIFTNITLVTMMFGYQLWGTVANKLGNRPVIQLLVVPSLFVPLLWAMTTKSNYFITIPLASTLTGICSSGISVAMTSLLYKTLPQGREVPEYFVIWQVFTTIGGALGPFLSGLMKNSLGDAELSLLGFPVSGLQIVFLIAAAATLLPIALSFTLQEGQSASPMYVLGQFRGNLFSFAYNFAVYASATEDELRARTLRALGRSHSPLALGPLLRGLDDTSPIVRQSAVEGLGASGLDEGLDPLVQTLQDEESDVRPTAAQALGRLGKPEGVGPLVQALYDEDVRVRSSAALALGEIGGEDAREALYDALVCSYDRQLFPALVDAASRTGDLRIIEPAFERLPLVRSQVVRMQVLNAIGRVLRERNHFYRLRVTDQLGRAALLERMMGRIVRLSRAVRYGTPEQRERLAQLASEVAAAVAAEDTESLRKDCRELAEVVLSIEGLPEVIEAAAASIVLYLGDSSEIRVEEEEFVFLTIALTSILRHMGPEPRAVTRE